LHEQIEEVHWLFKQSLEKKNDAFFHTHIFHRSQLGSREKEDQTLDSSTLTVASHCNSDAHILNVKNEIHQHVHFS
jgi:hypothetical protein